MERVISVSETILSLLQYAVHIRSTSESESINQVGENLYVLFDSQLRLRITERDGATVYHLQMHHRKLYIGHNSTSDDDRPNRTFERQTEDDEEIIDQAKRAVEDLDSVSNYDNCLYKNMVLILDDCNNYKCYTACAT